MRPWKLRPPSVVASLIASCSATSLKHVVEPYAVYRYENGVHNFANIIRFDERDIIADSKSAEYGVVNRLYRQEVQVEIGVFSPKYLPSDTPPAELAKKSWPRTRGLCDDSRWLSARGCDLDHSPEYFLSPTFGGALVPNQRERIRQHCGLLRGIAF